MDPRKTFEYQVEQPDPETLVYHMQGRLRGWPECFEFQEDIRKRVTGGTGRIVLDMERVETVDSTGVGILAAIYTTIKNADSRLVLVALTARVQRILDVLWFLRTLEHVDTVEAAMEALESPAPPPET